MNHFRYILLSIICGGIVSACSISKIDYEYDLPVQTIKLKKELKEISGMCYLSDSTIACVQDEEASIYYLNINTGKIDSSYDFGHNGDFEGLAINGNKAYILRSDGNIFVSKNQEKAKEREFKHGKDFDFEGLCLDEESNQLLVACKEHGKESKRKTIYIYAFSLETEKYLDKPLFKIEKERVHPNFKASGIAINPDGNIYVLSSSSNTVLVLNKKGKVVSHTQLSKKIFRQPEGICFDLNGDLYISNEANGTYSTLLKIERNLK